ncbi:MULTISPECIES: AAA family ATPase [unclassified Clostridium]|uniref:AAA family ATPase n=1 Tax=unclassified Clostridium TaxID=2614128 RepID=UPI0025C48617|nr:MULTISPECIES: AAA family ATPase [unclassified Clostridium]
MSGVLNRFVIHKLWGEQNYELKFNDNKLIIVGENGSGKTTILRILYEVLACRWGMLSQEDFESIDIEINNEVKSLYKSDIENSKSYLVSMNEDAIRELPPLVRRKIFDRSEYSGREMTLDQIMDIISEFDFPEYYYSRALDELRNRTEALPENIKYLSNWINNSLNCSIIYMPIYRRIERKIGYIKEKEFLGNKRMPPSYYRNKMSFDERTKRIMEISQTGMDDVHLSITMTIDSIQKEYNSTASKLNLECFKGIITQSFNKDIVFTRENLNPKFIDKVFGSINENILPQHDILQIKKRLLEMMKETQSLSEYDKIVYYFYHMLVQRFIALKKKEETIERYFEACNQYLVNKHFEYKSSEFTYELVVDGFNGTRRIIDLEQLSSGEKQIVSLFNYIYLSPIEDIMLLIDEPELSLSVPWQESILEDIIQGGSCKSLIAVTHSPFIYSNNMEQFTRALEEFSFNNQEENL